MNYGHREDIEADQSAQQQQRPFAREERYLVIKIKDAFTYLTRADVHWLRHLTEVIDMGRAANGKRLFNCAVVEDDWPEYEPVWAAIEARVAGASTAIPLTDPELDASHGPTKMLLAVEHWKAAYQSIKFERDELRAALAKSEAKTPPKSLSECRVGPCDCDPHIEFCDQCAPQMFKKETP